jgi:hypothetical protein
MFVYYKKELVIYFRVLCRHLPERTEKPFRIFNTTITIAYGTSYLGLFMGPKQRRNYTTIILNIQQLFFVSAPQGSKFCQTNDLTLPTHFFAQEVKCETHGMSCLHVHY